MTANHVLWIAFVAALYGTAGAVALRLVASLCATIVPFADGPAPGKPPTLALLGAVTLLGGLLAARGCSALALASFGLLIVSLAACWYSDVRCGIVLDAFTLGPLAIVLGLSLAARDLAPALAAVVVLVPFAVAAFVSKGRGMGWGDVKLVALGAAVLGLPASLLACVGACVAAVVIAYVRRRRYEPIAFAPYLAGSIALVVAGIA